MDGTGTGGGALPRRRPRGRRMPAGAAPGDEAASAILRRARRSAQVAVLGGAESHGRFVTRAWPLLLERQIGAPVRDLSLAHPGLDAWLADDALIAAAQRARAVAIALPPPRCLSNRFYKVHPRRNDRVVQVTPMLRAVFPEMDFTEQHFTGHLLRSLAACSAARFGLVRQELQALWLTRMNLLMARIGRPAVLVWLGSRAPEVAVSLPGEGEPDLIDGALLARLRGQVAGRAVVVRTAEDLAGEGGKSYPPEAALQAASLPGPETHAALAAAVGEALNALWHGGEEGADAERLIRRLGTG